MSRTSLLYFGVLGLHLVSLFTPGVSTEATKLLIVPTLGYAVWREHGPLTLLYGLALAFSWVGDFFLLLSADGLRPSSGGVFNVGICSFGLAHCTYCWLAVGAGARPPSRVATTVLVAVAAGLYGVAGLPIIVTIYMVTVVGLLLTTGGLSPKPTAAGEEIDIVAFAKTYPGVGRLEAVLPGAVAFAASDAIIGAQLLAPALLPRPYTTAATMLLYGVGQWGLRGLAGARRPWSEPPLLPGSVRTPQAKTPLR